jgi:hypothetical protein
MKYLTASIFLCASLFACEHHWCETKKKKKWKMQIKTLCALAQHFARDANEKKIEKTGGGKRKKRKNEKNTGPLSLEKHHNFARLTRKNERRCLGLSDAQCACVFVCVCIYIIYTILPAEMSAVSKP